MKIFILLSRVPYPLEKGDKLRAWHQIKELSKNHKIYLVCLSDSKIHPEAYSQLKEYCEEVKFYNLNFIGTGFRLLLGLFSSKPFQVHYFFRRSIQRKINRFLNGIKPDHIYVQLVRVSEYVKNIHHIPKTLDYMDALSKGMERRAAKSKGITGYFLRSEYKRLLAYENLIFDYFENKTVISEEERKLIYHPDQKKIKIITNGVDTEYFSPEKSSRKYDLLFNGNMSYPPNIDCVVYIAEKIMPLLKKQNKNYSLLISGATPSKKVIRLGQDNRSIHVSGWMDDIRNAYNACGIFLAPMQIGTGLQNKLLEAMSMGLPCITSQLANNALGAIPNEEILICQTPEEIVAAIELLINDKELYQKLSENGKGFVIEKYNWNASVRELATLFSAKDGN